MTIIEASFVKVAGTLADGTLRLVVDVEPRNAQAAFALFNSPGTPMALAALKAGYAAASPAPAQLSERTGPLCIEAVRYCAMPEFQDWAGKQSGDGSDMTGARNYILSECNVESRKELDTDAIAAEAFVRNIRTPFMRYMREVKK